MRRLVVILYVVLLLMSLPRVLRSAEIPGDTPRTGLGITVPDGIAIKDENTLKSHFIERNAPWLTAIILGLLTVGVNSYIARQMMRSNDRNIKSQLESNENNIYRQFRAKVKTQNRQDWINDVRRSLSDFLSKSTTYALYAEIKDERCLEFIEPISYSKSMLQLLLASDDLHQRNLIDCVEKYYDAELVKDSELYGKSNKYRNELIECAGKFFKAHWEDIQNLD